MMVRAIALLWCFWGQANMGLPGLQGHALSRLVSKMLNLPVLQGASLSVSLHLPVCQ
jgi:hypothetical protein